MRARAVLLALLWAAPLAQASGVAPASAPAPAEDPSAARAAELARELARDHATPRAFVPLAELEALEADLRDLGPLARAYRALSADPRAHPEVRGAANMRLAAVERARGRDGVAAAALHELAFLGGWSVAGPFDNDGRSGFDRVFPPERAQDLGARFPGKVREVGWRPLPPEALSTGFAHLGAAVRPARDVVVYALAVVESPRARRVRLRLGASGAVKVFVNGALVLADPTYHPARLDQAAVEVGLRAGPNRILVKLCHAEGRLGLFARLSDPAERPLRLGSVQTAPLPPLPPPGSPAAERPKLLPGAITFFEHRARVASGAAAARAHLDLAIALAERRPGDDREGRAAEEARAAARLAPGWVRAELLAARLEGEGNARRGHLDAALAAAPGDAEALLARGAEELGKGRLFPAKRLLDRAILAAPRSVPARLARADLDEAAGFGARARAIRAALGRDEPDHPGAVLAGARAARSQDRLDEAAALLRRGLELRHDDAAARASLVALLLDKGDLGGALRLLGDAIRLDPADLAPRLRLADLLASNGRLDEAERAYAEALRLCPEEADVRERRGLARLRGGHPVPALADLEAALELKPQSPHIKELVRALEPARERFEAPYLLDARALAKAAPPTAPGEDAVVLGALEVTKVFPSGLSSRFTQLVVKVLTRRGVDAWRGYAVSYVPDRQELRVERARIVKPDGSVVDGHGESDHSSSEPWYRLYYDERTRQLSFPALAPGDLLELAVRKDDVASENLLADSFGEVIPLADGTRRARADYVLLVPPGRRIFASRPEQPGVARTERQLPDGEVEHRWSARDLPALHPEPGMPGWSEVAPIVHVSTYESWDDVARFYWGLVREAVAPTAEVRAVAERLRAEVLARRRAAGDPASGDALALVQAVHHFVVTNIRYVALELGIHGFKPYRVDQILQRRFGDCKDKASLSHALLEALGIDSRLVLLRMRRLGRIPEWPASLSVFNHAILYVPRFDLWLDGTASYSGSRELPGEDRGAAVLVVNPGEPARFTTVPEARPEDNRTESQYRIALAPDGSAIVHGERRVAGAQAPSYRRAYAAEGDRRAVLEASLAHGFPGLTVKEVSVSDLSHTEEDVAIRFTLATPRTAEPEVGALRIAPFGGEHRYAEALAPLSSRVHDLVTGGPWETRLSYRFALPPGWRLAELPAPVRLASPQATFEAAWREENGALVAEAHLTLLASRVSAADYPAFRELLSEIDLALARPVRALAPDAGRQASR